MGTATLTFELSGKSNTIYVGNARSLTGVSVLARQLIKYSLAGIPNVTYTEGKFLDLSPDYPIVPADVGVFINLRFRSRKTGNLTGLMIPAPLMSVLDEVEGIGYRLDRSEGEKLAVYYSQYAGETFAFDDGWLSGSSTRGNSAA